MLEIRQKIARRGNVLLKTIAPRLDGGGCPAKLGKHPDFRPNMGILGWNPWKFGNFSRFVSWMTGTERAAIVRTKTIARLTEYSRFCGQSDRGQGMEAKSKPNAIRYPDSRKNESTARKGWNGTKTGQIAPEGDPKPPYLCKETYLASQSWSPRLEIIRTEGSSKENFSNERKIQNIDPNWLGVRAIGCWSQLQ